MPVEAVCLFGQVRDQSDGVNGGTAVIPLCDRVAEGCLNAGLVSTLKSADRSGLFSRGYVCAIDIQPTGPFTRSQQESDQPPRKGIRFASLAGE